MRFLALVAVLAASGCGGADEGGPSSSVPSSKTDLAIRVWVQGDLRKQPLRWTLRCEPTGGSLPRAARACERLLAVDDPFAEVPPDVACTEIYGGPQVAEVNGVLDGEAIFARFSRTDGCQIERWDRVRFLFPLGLNT